MVTTLGNARRRGNNSPEPTQRGCSSTPCDAMISTFANVDLKVARAAKDEYVKRCDTLSRENAQLRAQLQEHEYDLVKVLEHLKGELQKAHASMAEQSGEIHRLLSESADTESAMRLQYERMLEERDEQIIQYTSLVRQLKTELMASSRYAQQREEHILEVERLQNQLEDATTRHESELAALRLQTIDRKMRLITMEETMQKSFKYQVEMESERLLEAKSQALLEDYKALQQERERLTKDIEELVQLTTTKNAECADARRKGLLHRRACEEAMRRIVHGNRRMRESEVKMQRIEQRQKELLHEKHSQQEELSNKYEAKIQALEKTLAETRCSLEWHRTELRRLRQVATAVVEQRSDLERFFYVALNDVRRMRSHTSQRSKTPVAQTTPLSLPSVSAVDRSNVGVPIFHEAHQHPNQSLLLTHPKSTLPMDSRNSTFLTDTPMTSPGIVLGPTPLPATARLPPPARRPIHSASRKFRDELPSGGGGVNINNMKNSRSSRNNPMDVKLGDPGEGAYMDDLSWGDKEKIIKALLFFINQTLYQRPSEDYTRPFSPLPVVDASAANGIGGEGNVGATPRAEQKSVGG